MATFMKAVLITAALACTAMAEEHMMICDSDDLDMDICNDKPWGYTEPEIDICDTEDSDICSDDDDELPYIAPTPAPPPPVMETTFAADVAVDDATKFDEQAYVAQLTKELEAQAAVTGVKPDKVEVAEKKFVTEVSYKFSADEKVTEPTAKKAIAAAVGVLESRVEVTISRRLDESRRLAVDTKVDAKITTADATLANSVKEAAAKPAALQTALANVGVTATATVEKAPATTVKVTTKVAAEGTKAVAPPDAAKIAAVGTAAGGTGATVDQSTVDIKLRVGPPQLPVIPLDLSGLATERVKYTGTVSFEATGLSQLNAEAATQRTLANRLGVEAKTISVTGTESRRLNSRLTEIDPDLYPEDDVLTSVLKGTIRLTQGADPRRLVGKWSVAFEVTIAKADEEAFKETATKLQNDNLRQLLFRDVLSQKLIVVGASAESAGSLVLKEIPITGIPTQAEIDAAAVAAAEAEEATDAANTMSCNFFLAVSVCTLAFFFTKQNA